MLAESESVCRPRASSATTGTYHIISGEARRHLTSEVGGSPPLVVWFSGRSASLSVLEPSRKDVL